MLEMIVRDFGSFEAFKKEFEQKGATLFGSGWVWLSLNGEGRLVITQEANAGNPLRSGLTPLLTFDVWEHAYYIDYRNARPKFIAAFFDKLVNWRFAEERYEAKACTCGGNMGCKA
jgi:Fe-Mn family superoxide dismutase